MQQATEQAMREAATSVAAGESPRKKIKQTEKAYGEGPKGRQSLPDVEGGLQICCHTHAHGGGCLIAHFLFASNGSRHEVGIRARRKGSRVMSAHKGNTLSSSSWLPPAAQSR